MDWEQKDYILIIEDDDGFSECLTEMLQEKGHRVVSFGDGQLALDYLRQKSVLPRLIFLDFLMPRMDGWQFLAERRKDARIANVPVVGITGSDLLEEEGAPSTLSHMLKKPVSIDALMGVVQRWAPTTLEA